MQALLDLARTMLALVFLTYASWSDHKTREVSDTVWLVLAPAGFTLVFVELSIFEYSSLLTQMLFYGLCFGLTAAFSIILFYSGGFGGADAKALMCLALALPFYPKNLLQPLSGDNSPISQVFFPLTVFSNAVLFAAATTIYILCRNFFWRLRSGRRLFEGTQGKEPTGKKILVLLTGYKMPIEKLKEKWHLYPLEDVEEAPEREISRKLIVMPRDEGRNQSVGRLEQAVNAGKIKDMIWTSPGLPLLIFITAGLVIALLFGDVIWVAIRFLLS